MAGFVDRDCVEDMIEDVNKNNKDKQEKEITRFFLLKYF